MQCFLLKRKTIALCTSEYLLLNKEFHFQIASSTVCLLFNKNSSTTGHLRGPCWVISSQRAEIYLHNLHLQKMRVIHIFIKQENALVWPLTSKWPGNCPSQHSSAIPSFYSIRREGRAMQTDQCASEFYGCILEWPILKELGKRKRNLLLTG